LAPDVVETILGLVNHDFFLSSLAHDAIECAQAQAARHRLVIEARRAGEEPATFGLARVPAGERITGFVALVIQPDAATIRTSWDLAASLMPPASEHLAGPGSLPHLTLTQCALRDAPRERLREYVARLEDQLRGRPVPLDAVVTFGAGFLFWCAEATARAFADDPVLVGNARTHGYALIRERYLPHITLGFDPRLRDRPAGPWVASRLHTMTVDRVVLAALGRHGRVEAAFSL